MAHQVFVSYATEDADTAAHVCALLEADGIVCWMAPRDVEAGTDYAAAIMDAIRNSQLVVLIFSTFSNASPYVLREIERAVAYQRPVLALRTDDTVPNSSIEYYVNVWQKLKAAAEVEKKQEEIVAAVRDAIRASKAAGQSQAGVPRKAVKMRRWARRRWWILAAAAVVLVAAAAAGGTWAATHTGGHMASPGLMGHNTWTELYPEGTPSARSGHEMAYDSDTHRMIMFGGGPTLKSDAARANLLHDTWAYDPAANTWTELKPAGPLPHSAREPSDGVRSGYPSADHVRRIRWGGDSFQRHLGLLSGRQHLDRTEPGRNPAPCARRSPDGLRCLKRPVDHVRGAVG